MFGRWVAAFTMVVALVTFFIAWKVAEEVNVCVYACVCVRV